jgi:hypothetical protein
MSVPSNHDKFILLNGINIGIQSMNTTLASGALLAKLNALGNVSLMLYNYIGRNAFGQAGGAAYAYYKGSDIKNDPKRHGSMSNKLIIGSTFAESVVNYLPISGKLMFVPLVAANVGKNIGWMGSGAVNAHYMSKIAKDDIADMYTKMSAVNSFAATVGTMAGLGLTTFTIGKPMVGMGLCGVLCIANKLVYDHMLSIAEI